MIAARFQRYAEIDELLSSPPVRHNLAGGSRSWIGLLRQVVEVARYSQNSVLLIGESGTGKELIARLIHALDPRPNKSAFVVLEVALGTVKSRLGRARDMLRRHVAELAAQEPAAHTPDDLDRWARSLRRRIDRDDDDDG